jgi:hypothetical protein
MSDIFTPQLFQGLPAPAMPGLPAPGPELAMPPAPAMPAPPPPQTVFVPVPIIPPKAPPKPKGMQVSPEAARKAQGIYPQEQAEKQTMINNAKAPPTPTGAWGAPK